MIFLTKIRVSVINQDIVMYNASHFDGWALETCSYHPPKNACRLSFGSLAAASDNNPCIVFSKACSLTDGHIVFRKVILRAGGKKASSSGLIASQRVLKLFHWMSASLIPITYMGSQSVQKLLTSLPQSVTIYLRNSVPQPRDPQLLFANDSIAHIWNSIVGHASRIRRPDDHRSAYRLGGILNVRCSFLQERE